MFSDFDLESMQVRRIRLCVALIGARLTEGGHLRLRSSVPSGWAVSPVSRPETPVELSETPIRLLEVQIRVGAPIRLTRFQLSYFIDFYRVIASFKA
jgi:hypothetical protein